MKFSIVTPAYNGERFLKETIESVLAQEGDFEIEYILQDGGSTDTTVQIFEEYKGKNLDMRITMLSFSEKDQGMYDAIDKGFAHATGDIFAWINCDDTYLPGAFEAMAKTFAAFPKIEWLKGRTQVVAEDSTLQHALPCYLYNQSWITRGIYGRNAYFIHQDSVFWRKDLWQKAGSIDPALRLAGDYALWINFAKHAPLYSLDLTVSNFRRVVDSLSLRDHGAAYRSEVSRIAPSRNDWLEMRIKIFFTIANRLPAFRQLYPLLFRHTQKEYVAWQLGSPILQQTYSFIL